MTQYPLHAHLDRIRRAFHPYETFTADHAGGNRDILMELAAAGLLQILPSFNGIAVYRHTHREPIGFIRRRDLRLNICPVFRKPQYKE